ncbi:MAG: hypothetical protein LBG95_01020 [Treponema sp.]|jgi:uncharacterized integral membrane protein|nr:hypothetical protein [Treponema sp.]
MPWRLIQFFVIFAIFFLFIIFNLGNKCDISFGITKVKDVPVFITVFSGFFAGMLCSLPFVLSYRLRKKEENDQGKGLLAKASRKKDKDSSEISGGIKSPDNSPYGID